MIPYGTLRQREKDHSHGADAILLRRQISDTIPGEGSQRKCRIPRVKNWTW